MGIKAQVYGVKETSKWDPRGYIYCWYYRVINTETGNVLAADNTGNWRLIFDSAARDAAAIHHCNKLGIIKKSRGW